MQYIVEITTHVIPWKSHPVFQKIDIMTPRVCKLRASSHLGPIIILVLSDGGSLQKLELSISDKVVGKNRYLFGLKDLLVCFLSAFTVQITSLRYVIIVMPLVKTTNWIVTNLNLK